MIAAIAPSPLWFVSRGLGAAALALLTASLAVGIIAGAGARSPGWPRFASATLHRNLSLFALVLLGVHIATAVLDPFARIAWRDVVVPFGSVYRPYWVGLGAISFDLLVAVGLTTAIRRRLGYRLWRAIHWTGYACWPPALLHMLGTGSDIRSPWLAALATMCLLTIAGLVAWRVTVSRVRPGLRAVVHNGLVAGVALVVGFTATGPLRPGWARAAGTPAEMLGGSAAKPAPTASPDRVVDDSGGHRLSVTEASAPGGRPTFLMTDRADPSVQIVVRPPRQGEPGPVLAVVHSGQVGCVAAATIAESISARCGATLVRIRLDGTPPTMSGWLWVSPTS